MLKIPPAAEDAFIIYLGEEISARVAERVQRTTVLIEQALADVLIDLTPSYASVLVTYDCYRIGHQDMRARLRALLKALDTAPQQACQAATRVTLPVYYGAEVALDLPRLAARAQLPVEEVVALHCSQSYRVYAIGFAPGFAYMGQVDSRIAAPRLQTPRARVPRGAVAIADRQTAIYPAESPGGWNLIGRCPVPMFDVAAEAGQPAMPVQVGDRVYFESIDREQFLALGGVLDD